MSNNHQNHSTEVGSEVIESKEVDLKHETDNHISSDTAKSDSHSSHDKSDDGNVKNEHHHSSKSHHKTEEAPEFKEFSDLEKILHFYLVKKAPALPEGIKEVIVSISPWIAVALLIFSILAILFLLGLSAFIPFALVGGVSSGFGYFASTIGSIASLVLYALAIPGLFSRSKQGWNFIYYSNLASLVVAILNFNIIGGFVGSAIGMYFLFQVQSYYKTHK